MLNLSLPLSALPKDWIIFGADLYPAPFAQSNTILVFFNLKFLGIFFLKIFKYSSVIDCNLLTLTNIFGFD